MTIQNKEFEIVLDDIERLAKLSSNSLVRNATYGFVIHAPDLDTAIVFATDAMDGVNLGEWHVEEVKDDNDGQRSV